MGPQIMSIIMRTLAVIVFAATVATISGESFEEAFNAPEMELMQAPEMNEVSDLMSAVTKLRAHAPQHLAEHVAVVTKHAKTIQLSQDADEIEKACKSIKAALDTLRGELRTGHNHDVKLLKDTKSTASTGLSNTRDNNKNKVKKLKHEGCPTKRSEERADSDKKAAKKARDDVKNKKICPLGTTWDDMDIHKSVPKYGTELRGAWDKARADWVKKNNAYVAATKAHNNAIVVHEQKMAAFKTAMKLEAKSTHDQCQSAHNEYNALKKDVQANVETRKQVDISAKVVQCYVDNMTNNAGAKACADKARKADVSMWNIDGGSLTTCESTSSLENAFGPPSWTATASNCAKKEVTKEVETKEVETNDPSTVEEEPNTSGHVRNREDRNVEELLDLEDLF